MEGISKDMEEGIGKLKKENEKLKSEKAELTKEYHHAQELWKAEYEEELERQREELMQEQHWREIEFQSRITSYNDLSNEKAKLLDKLRESEEIIGKKEKELAEQREKLENMSNFCLVWVFIFRICGF